MGDLYGGVDSYLKQLEQLTGEGLGAAQQQYTGSNSAYDTYLGALSAQQSGNGMVNVPLMAFAAGLGAPTKTGSFGESLSAGMNSAIPQITAQRQTELQRAEAMSKIQLAKANLSQQLYEKKLAVMDVPFAGLTKYNQAVRDRQNIDFNTRMRAQQDAVASGDKTAEATPDVTAPPDPAVAAVPTPPTVSADQTVTAATTPSAGVNGRIAAARAGVPEDQPVFTPPAQAAGPGPTNQAASELPTEGSATVEQPGSTPGYVTPDTQQPIVAAATTPKPKPPAKAVTDALAGSVIDPVAVPPMPKGYKPGEQVDLGGGMIGYRPPAALAKQLDNAYRMSQMGLQWPGATDAGPITKQGQEILDKLAADHMTWDPVNKAVVPIGTNDPRYQRRSELMKRDGTLTADDQHTTVKIPDPKFAGPTSLAPMIDVPKDWFLQQQRAAVSGKPDAPASLMTEPSALTEAGAKPFMEAVQALPNEMKKSQIAIENGEHAKRLLAETPTGAVNEYKQKTVAILRGVGLNIPDEMLPDKSWSPANWEQLQKLATKQVFSDVMDIGGRVLVSEIQGLQQANFSPGLQPDSNRAILASTQAQEKYKADYLNAFQQWRKTNPYNIDASQFAADWIGNHHYEDYYKHEMTTTVAKGAAPLDSRYYQPPPLSQRTAGMKINMPAFKSGVGEWAQKPDGSWGWAEVK